MKQRETRVAQTQEGTENWKVGISAAHKDMEQKQEEDLCLVLEGKLRSREGAPNLEFTARHKQSRNLETAGDMD